MDQNNIKAVRSVFKEHFSTEPAIFFSPGRINLIGEHTDYNLGYVMPAAIDRGITIGIGLSTSKRSTLISTAFPEHIQFDTNADDARGEHHWSSYVLGVIAEMKKYKGRFPQLDMVIASDLPIGSGLSSSAALENAVSFGLNHCLQLELEKIELAKIGQRTENLHIGIDCGIMDQFAGLFGKKDQLIFLDCRNLEYEHLKWPFDDHEILLVDSKVSRELVGSEFNKRKESCNNAARACGKKSLRELDMETFELCKHLISENDFRKARYVIDENLRVLSCAKAIRSSDIEELGNLMVKSHIGLREEYEVSCRELDFLVDRALENPGVVGSRMMGGGFGGCTINLVSKHVVPTLQHAVSKAYREQFNKVCEFYLVKLWNGTYQIQ